MGADFHATVSKNETPRTPENHEQHSCGGTTELTLTVDDTQRLHYPSCRTRRSTISCCVCVFLLSCFLRFVFISTNAKFQESLLSEVCKTRAALNTIWAHCTAEPFVVHHLRSCNSDGNSDHKCCRTKQDKTLTKEPKDTSMQDSDSEKLCPLVSVMACEMVCGMVFVRAFRIQATEKRKFVTKRLCVANLHNCACQRRNDLCSRGQEQQKWISAHHSKRLSGLYPALEIMVSLNNTSSPFNDTAASLLASYQE